MKNNKKIIVVGLILAILFVSVGYAALQTTLTITGTATAKNNTWSIDLQNVANTAGVAPTTPPAISGTTLTYAVTLTKPGDYYEFTVDVKNNGSIDAKLAAAPVITGTSSYITHTVTYSDGTAIGADDTLDAGETKTLKVKVLYRTDLDASSLPTSSSQVTYTVSLNYVQA